MSRTKFRKRSSQKQVNQSVHSARMRELGTFISRQNYAEGLSGINDELKKRSCDMVQRGRLLSLAGDAEFKRGRFSAATEIYQRASNELDQHPTRWLRAHIGTIRSLLNQSLIKEAETLSHSIIEQGLLRQKKFTELIAEAERIFPAKRCVEVPAAPLRTGMIASRIGHLFLARGEINASKMLFIRAIELEKRGAIKARIGLARIALAEGDAARAFQLARDSIVAGKASAKTLPCWSVLVAARRKLGGWMIGDDLIACLKNAPPSVRARATVLLVVEMRKHDMRQWQSLALDWLESGGRKFPAAEAEIKKMILASWKALPGHLDEKHDAAKRLLLTTNLSRNEWLCSIKEVVRSGLMRGDFIDLDALVARAAGAFDPAFGFQVRHSLALTCMSAGHHKSARRLLTRNIESADCPTRLQSKSVWAYGRMEQALQNHESAARIFHSFANQERYDLKFRLQARLLWVESMIAAGQAGAIMAAQEELGAALDGVTDATLLMNISRQIRAITPELDSLAFRLFDRAVQMAFSGFEKAAHPAIAMDLLFQLTRRMVCDFDRHDDAVRIWENLPAGKREWLWQASDRYWEFLALLITAYGRSRGDRTAEILARKWMEDPSVPLHGRVHIGHSLGHWFIEKERIDDALVLYGDLVSETPSHPLSASAWYWLALEAHRGGDIDYRNSSATAIRRALGPDPGLLEEWRLDARALILLHDLDPAVPAEHRPDYDDAFMHHEAAIINRDLARIP